MHDSSIKALVSLDGGIGTASAIDAFKRAPWFSLSRSLPPALLHLFPSADPFMAPDFTLLRALHSPNLVLRELTGLHHLHFSTLGFQAAGDGSIAQLTNFGAAGRRHCERWPKKSRQFLEVQLVEDQERNNRRSGGQEVSCGLTQLARADRGRCPRSDSRATGDQAGNEASLDPPRRAASWSGILLSGCTWKDEPNGTPMSARTAACLMLGLASLGGGARNQRKTTSSDPDSRSIGDRDGEGPRIRRPGSVHSTRRHARGDGTDVRGGLDALTAGGASGT